MPDPVPKVFICYARADNQSEDPHERWLDRMMRHLKPLEASGMIKVFCDIDLKGGDHWRELIQKELEETRVAILLVSAAFMESDFIRNNELPVLLEKAFQPSPRLKIIPVILSESLFDEVEYLYPDSKTGPKRTRLSSLQTVGSPSKGLRDLPNNEQERLLKEVAKLVATECRRPSAKPQDLVGIPKSAPQSSTPEKTEPHDLRNLPPGKPWEPQPHLANNLETIRDPIGLRKSSVGRYWSIIGVVFVFVVSMFLTWVPWRNSQQGMSPSTSTNAIPAKMSSTNTIRGFTNSLGMQFVPVEGTEVWFSILETRWQDYKAFADSTNGLDDSWRDPEFGNLRVTPSLSNPVVNVSWTEACAFCSWLTAKERKQGLLNPDQSYRLPTDLEWSAAVGLRGEIGATPNDRDEKVRGVYPWGTNWPPPSKVGNYADAASKKAFLSLDVIPNYDDGFVTTSPVGSFPPSANGLYDLSGNVWEWCEDWYDPKNNSKVLRGGSWYHGAPRFLLSSSRTWAELDARYEYFGFRVVLSVGGAGPRSGAQVVAAQTNASIVNAVGSNTVSAAPFMTIPSRCFTNSLGMRFVPIERTNLWFSIWETRWQDYKAFADSTNGLDDSWRDPKFEGVRVTPTPSNPVVNVSWTEACAFCSWLTAKEQEQGMLTLKQTYRLPTDLEWSAAAGLKDEVGATPKDRHENSFGVYPWGTNRPPAHGRWNFPDAAFHERFPKFPWLTSYDDEFATTSPVGTFSSMANGLYDLAGNVWEWCEDCYDGKLEGRVLRGGSWICHDLRGLSLSCRLSLSPGVHCDDVGFRVVLIDGGSDILDGK